MGGFRFGGFFCQLINLANFPLFFLKERGLIPLDQLPTIFANVFFFLEICPSRISRRIASFLQEERRIEVDREGLYVFSCKTS